MSDMNGVTPDSMSILHTLPADTALSSEARIEQIKRDIEQYRVKIEFNARRTTEYQQQIRNNQQANNEYLAEMMTLLKRLESELEVERG